MSYRRSRHDRLRWGRTADTAAPSPDVLAAHVYRLTYTDRVTGVSSSFLALALDQDMARECGEIRVGRWPQDGGVSCSGCERLEGASWEMHQQVLAHETEEERDHRRAGFYALEPEQERVYEQVYRTDALTVDERNDMAHKAHREGRR